MPLSGDDIEDARNGIAIALNATGTTADARMVWIDESHKTIIFRIPAEDVPENENDIWNGVKGFLRKNKFFELVNSNLSLQAPVDITGQPMEVEAIGHLHNDQQFVNLKVEIKSNNFEKIIRALGALANKTDLKEAFSPQLSRLLEELGNQLDLPSF